MKKKIFLIIITAFTALCVIAGCNMPEPKQTPGEPTQDLNMLLTQIAAEHQPESTPTEQATEEPTPTPKKTETLTVCLGKEPDTLFFYEESSRAMWSVLESIYDGPFDKGDGEARPVIFEDITVSTVPVTVRRGDIITDIDQNPVELKPGTTFLPAEPAEGCSGKDCLLTWDIVRETGEIPQTTITFRLKEGLTWSDGTPLTAEDSVYSMILNGTRGIKASRTVYNLTDSYTAIDDHTVEWRGLPGYQPEDPSDVFWTPLPKHIMKGMSVEEILASDAVNKTPLGWGAWQITSWDRGNEIVAERNPYYFSEDGSEPFFDRIVYKFYGRAGDNNLEALHSGTCDIIDTSADLSADMEEILEDVRDGKQAVYIQPELTRQELVLNLKPSGTNSSLLFASPDLRKAVTQCIDRSGLIREVLFGQSEVPADLCPAGYSGHNESLTAVGYDPDSAKELLAGLPEGLTFTLTTSDSAASKQAAEYIRKNLSECGIEVIPEALSLGDLYAQGPDGIIFGGGFDAAMFAWSAGSSHACAVYMSDQIPDEANHWIGTNVGAYRNDAYDEACLLPDLTETDAGQIYAEELPAIPLYFNISIGVSDNHICGISDKIDSRSILWNMERFSRSEDRCAVSQWNDIYK